MMTFSTMPDQAGMRECRGLNENDAEAHPNTGTEIETHPKHLFSPVFTCLSNPTAHDCVFQALDNAEITQAGPFPDPPARKKIEGDIHRQYQDSCPGAGDQTDR